MFLTKKLFGPVLCVKCVAQNIWLAKYFYILYFRLWPPRSGPKQTSFINDNEGFYQRRHIAWNVFSCQDVCMQLRIPSVPEHIPSLYEQVTCSLVQQCTALHNIQECKWHLFYQSGTRITATEPWTQPSKVKEKRTSLKLKLEMTFH